MSAHNAIRFIQANRKCLILPAALTSSVASTVCNKPARRTTVFSKSACIRRFFVFAASLAPACLSADIIADAACQHDKPDAYVRIKHVIDGDTVILANGDRLRMIGIDAPEIGYRGKASQAGAISARDFLKGLINSRDDYPVSFEPQRRDRYGRTLGHLFLTDNRNIQALILAGGFAAPLNIPPNIAFSNCYQQQVTKAMQARLGIWKLDQYQAVAANLLSGNEQGYRIIYGRIFDTATTPSSIWLHMQLSLAIRIAREDLQYFPDFHPDELPGRDIRVRGKLYRYKTQLRLRLRHPADMEILTMPAPR